MNKTGYKSAKHIFHCVGYTIVIELPLLKINGKQFTRSDLKKRFQLAFPTMASFKTIMKLFFYYQYQY